MKTFLPVSLAALVVLSTVPSWAQNPVAPAQPAVKPTPKPVAPPAAKPAVTQTKLGANTSGRVVLTDGSRSVTRTARELGLFPTVNLAALKEALTRIAPTFKQDAVNAYPYVNKGQVAFNPGSYSRTLNVATTATLLAQATQQSLPKTFPVSLDKKPPVLTVPRLKGINGVLSSVTTTAADISPRNKNVTLGAGAIDGSFLSPGEQFSLNKTVGPRVKERGFKEAIIFVDAEEVKGFGGGISQVTGTTFTAAARAGMKIDEANLHSRTVAYLPPGYDATVAWPDKDMKFTNNTKYPVYISMHFQNQKLTTTLFGHKEQGQRVVLKNTVQRLGPGRINAQLYRVIKQNGQIVSKERLVNHQYRWDPSKKGVQPDPTR